MSRVDDDYRLRGHVRRSREKVRSGESTEQDDVIAGMADLLGEALADGLMAADTARRIQFVIGETDFHLKGQR